MMKRVLVPLDKTEAAESVVPLIADLAAAGATVKLMHVAPVPDNLIGVDGHLVAYADQEVARLEAEWTDYLLSIEARLPAGIEHGVRFGNPTAEILAEAETFGADTIVVTTATRSTVMRALGSVSEAVMRRASVGVLLYRPPVSA